MINVTTTKRSGTGGAHLGLFGRSLMLRAPEGEPAAGAAPNGANGAPPPGATGAPPAAPPPAEAPKTLTLTQAQLDGMIQDRLARDRAARSQQPATPPATEQEMSPRQLQDAYKKLQRRDEFRDIADELGIPRENRADMFDLLEAQQPADRRAWAATKAQTFGVKQQQQQQSSTPPPATVSPPVVENRPPPAAAPRAPGQVDTFVDSGGLTDIYTMDPAKLAALPPGKIRELHERNVQLVNAASGAPPIPRIGPKPQR